MRRGAIIDVHPSPFPMKGGIHRGQEIVAVLPAAGYSRRLAPLPCSKELLPVGRGTLPGYKGRRPKVASHFLLECLRHAGIRKCYMVIRKGKWDIPAYWGDGDMLGMHFAYVAIESSSGPPDTIDRAYPFIKNKVVAFGFPDILFRPKDVFSRLLSRLGCGSVDIVLGLFPAHQTRAMDMIQIDAAGRVREVQLKPLKTRLRYAWLCGVWTPTFTEFLHRYLRTKDGRLNSGMTGSRRIDPQGDIPVGAVLRAAVQAKLKVEGVPFPTGRYIDIGTPEALSAVPRMFS